MERSISLHNEDTRNVGILSLFLLVILFLISPYSPLYRQIYDLDEAVYKVMSVGLLQGKMPYRDLFDHKGPLTYFLYGAGFLVSGYRNWGVFLLCWIFNIVAFYYVYKINRLFFESRISFFATVLVIVINTMIIRSINRTGCKPDNLILTPLMFSAYLYIKETISPKVEEFHNISNKSMFLMGIMCGCILMIKINICFIYFSFVGCYFLWLLIKKKVKVFLQNTGLFLLGILLAALPCLLFLLANHALQDFWNVYFVYNSRYAGNNSGIIYLTSEWLTPQAKIVVSIILVLSMIPLVSRIRQKRLTAQRWFLIALSLVTFFVMSIPVNISYYFIVFIPFYTLAFGALSEMISVKLKDPKSLLQLCGIIMVFLPLYLFFQLFQMQYISFKKTEKEQKMQAFAETHKDASCMFFDGCYLEGYLEYCSKIPDYRMFYIPPVNNEEAVNEQKEAIRQRLPETIVYSCVGEDAYDGERLRFMEENGYVLYEVFDSQYGGIEYFCVRDDFI